MKVSYRLVFDFKKDIPKKNKEKGLIQIQAYLNGSRRYFSTKVYLTPKEWDTKKNRPKDAYLEKTIKDFLNTFETFEIEYRALHGKFELSDFDIFLKPKEKLRPKTSFTKFFKEQIEKETQLELVTIQSHRNTLLVLTKFMRNIEFEDLNYSLIQDFDNFLRSDRNLKINTIEKYHRQLRKYINLAVKQNLMAENENPYRDFKLHTEETDTIFLRLDDIAKIESLVFNERMEKKDKLEKARDMFLFSCYTGLRFSDCKALTRENFEETANGLILKFRAKKTNKIGTRPLYLLFNGKPVDLVRKYWPTTEKRRLFHGMYNSTVNKLLKQIAVLAGVNRKLYFKASRDSFGTNLYILSKDPMLVQSQLQHSKREQTDKYVHLVEDIQNEKLRDIFKKEKNGK
ncbi:site-specific integrase [Lacihabitans lacunae]|uniref:Site-specific integrase n=1 Tax=Lacihabitans lacunae TaxID=1028214 RepID=A0ABV7Z154_9BACT